MLAEDDPQKMEMDIIDEQLDTLGKAVLGMTFGCARCHDHKYDPILQKDYYGLASIFASSNFKSYPQVPKAVADEYEKQTKTLEKKQEELKKFQEEASALYAKVQRAGSDLDGKVKYVIKDI